MSTSPLVSVGMPVLNCEKTIAVSIQSILNQTFTDWELIMIDDGSRDKTLTIATDFHDVRIRIVDGQQNLRLSSRLNQAVQLSKGKYFARMDGDDLAYPERLAKQVSFLEQHPEVDLLATSVSVFNDDASLLGLRPAPVSHDAICAHPWSGFHMAHATWMGKLEWFRANPYSVSAVQMEDKELLFRTYAKSNFACLAEVLVAYRENSLSFSKMLLARRNFVRALWQASGKHCSPQVALRGTFGQAIRVALEAVALSTGLGYRLLKHRARPASERELTRWIEVWRQTLSSVPQPTLARHLSL
jgi:glycosyltransferase involved in cell wall biosynthesis